MEISPNLSVTSWTVLGIIVLSFIYKYTRRSRYKFPPGPPGLPLLGNALQLDAKSSHLIFTKWAKEYGDIFRLKLLHIDVVVLNSFEAIYEGLVVKGNDFAGRPPVPRIVHFVNNAPEVAFTDFSPSWVQRKKIALQTLKMYGDNLENLEVISIDVIKDMLDDLRSTSENGPFDAYPFYYECTTGIMTSILFGKKGDKDIFETILYINSRIPELVQPTGLNILLDLIPGLKHVPNRVYSEIHALSERMKNMLQREIDIRKDSFESQNLGCFVDGLLAQTKGKELSELEIYGLTVDVFLAGTLTTTITVDCLVAVLVNKPDIQQKIANEIMEQLGSATPRLKDRKRLHYTEAAILEILRFSSIAPFGFPHQTTVDTSINGYDVPKGTQVFFNLWNLHHDTKYWTEPWEFKPERFLDDKGELVAPDHPNRQRLLPFGASRRVCLGETLARNRLFLMVTSLLQHFEFQPASANEIPRHDPRDYKVHFGLEMQRYRVNVVLRN